MYQNGPAPGRSSRDRYEIAPLASFSVFSGHLLLPGSSVVPSQTTDSPAFILQPSGETLESDEIAAQKHKSAKNRGFMRLLRLFAAIAFSLQVSDLMFEDSGLRSPPSSFQTPARNKQRTPATRG